ncbi:hypothetical protein PHLCEN_2v8264 [Hermanssonia centrifuga]|uniref:Uncharacterized protein n=1 Tax=Hermanssonia centrifuga TaxID=98765 RepID=A0A2R6NU21_9APHY|nr:hypothetical protein PHLCEN_2v8264 [Hermanssonia centrifuga]
MPGKVFVVGSPDSAEVADEAYCSGYQYAGSQGVAVRSQKSVVRHPKPTVRRFGRGSRRWQEGYQELVKACYQGHQVLLAEFRRRMTRKYPVLSQVAIGFPTMR